jgi:hypothetical protein
LKALTTPELIAVNAFISSLVALGPSSADRILTASNHNDWVLMGICDYMRSAQIDLSGVNQLTSGKHYETFRSKCIALHHYLKRCGNKVQQRAVLRLGIGLLHHDLENMGLAVSSRLMMAHIHRLPGIINKSFPGYAEAGLIHMIIRSEKDVREKQSGRAIQSRRKRISIG